MKVITLKAFLIPKRTTNFEILNIMICNMLSSKKCIICYVIHKITAKNSL